MDAWGEEEALVAFLMLSNHTWKGAEVRGGILLSIPSERMNPLLTKKGETFHNNIPVLFILFLHCFPHFLLLSPSNPPPKDNSKDISAPWTNHFNSFESPSWCDVRTTLSAVE